MFWRSRKPRKRGGGAILNQRPHLVKLLVQVLDRLHLPAPSRRGRPYVYAPRSILKCNVVMVSYRLTSLRSLERFLHQHPPLATACGVGDRIPSYRTFSRRFRTLEQPAWCAARQLLRRLTRRHWLRWGLLIIDSSLVAAHGRPPRPGPHPRPATDPDAAWGYSPSDGWVWGYKLHALVTAGLAAAPCAWAATRANAHDGPWLPRLLRQTPTWHGPCRGWVVGDGAYDSRHNVTACRTTRRRLLTPVYIRRWGLRAMSLPRRQRRRLAGSRQGRRLLRRRTVIERHWSQLKAVFAVDPLPVRGLSAVQTYVALVMVAYLAALAYNGSMRRGLRAIKSLVA